MRSARWRSCCSPPAIPIPKSRKRSAAAASSSRAGRRGSWPNASPASTPSSPKAAAANGSSRASRRSRNRACWRRAARRRRTAPITWTPESLGRALRIDARRVAQIWQAAGIDPKRVECFRDATDPRFEEKAADLIGLYVQGPQRVAVFALGDRPGRRRRRGPERQHGTEPRKRPRGERERPRPGARRHLQQRLAVALRDAEQPARLDAEALASVTRAVARDEAREGRTRTSTSPASSTMC